MSKVTIIIPYKNNLKYLFLALNSIFTQTYKDYNIILVYDKKDESDYALIKKFLKKKNKDLLEIVRNKKNLGVGKSRNIGIARSKTKFIAFLDSDDVWHKDKLRLQVNFMKNNNLPISHTSFNIVDKFGKKISERKLKKKLNFNDILNSCDIGLSTVMVERKFLKKYNLWFPKIKTKEDYILWLRVLRKTRYIIGLNKNLTNYRKLKNSLSSDRILSFINGYKVYKNYMKMGHIESLFRLIILSFNYLKKNLI